METRWLTETEIETQVNPALQAKGWAALNLDSCRVRGAFAEDGHLVEFFVIQLIPFVGPLLRVDNEIRDNGETTRALVSQIHSYLEVEQARGFIAFADTPLTQRLCERFGMTRIESPVYGFARVEVPA